MIKDFEFFNTFKKIGRYTIFRVSIRNYLVFMALLDNIKLAKKVSLIRGLQLEVIRLASNIKRPKIKHLPLFREIVSFNIPDTGNGGGTKKATVKTNSSKEDLYTNILIFMDVIVSEYASVSHKQILDEWNIFQILIKHRIITRRKGIEYQELTAITGLAKYKPQLLYDRYGKMITPEKPVSQDISLSEAFRLSRKAQGDSNAEFH